MKALLLDTSVIIDAERGRSTLDALLDDHDDLAIAAVTVAELMTGVHLATPHRRPARIGLIEALLEAIPVVPYDRRVAFEHGELLAWTTRHGSRRGAHDLIIAATATATGRALVTAYPRGFHGLPGVELLA